MGKCSWVTFERGAKTVLTFVFSHVGLCALVVGYSVAGAFLFTWLEQKAILKPFNSTEIIERCIDEIYNASEQYGFTFNENVALWRRDLVVKLKEYSDNVATAAKDETYDKTSEDLEERWSIINSLFFCVTAITTIGYGHISPRTQNGRLVTIIYSIFGIPLMLLCLNNIGDSMATTFRFSYRRIFCIRKKAKPTEIIPTSNPEPSRKQQQLPNKANDPKSRPPTPKSSHRQQKHLHYRPSRKNMLISPPISATIHRGSDLPSKLPSGPNTTQTGNSGCNTPNTGVSMPYQSYPSSMPSSFATRSSRPSPFSPNLSPCLQLDMHSIVAECAEYTGTPVPNPPTPNYDANENSSASTSTPSPSGNSAPSMDPSAPSSPFNKDAPQVWYTGKENGESFLQVPQQADGPYSNQSTRPASPVSGWADQMSMMSMGSCGRPWNVPDSSASVTWATPLDDDDEEFAGSRVNSQKRPAGKTLVVYNTLSGDALKQQTKIQRKMALNRAKHGHTRNEATTVFTDPVSGQPVNGDMLGLNYRPIEQEPTDRDTRVPIILVLAFVFSYLLLGALLFSSLEAWHFVESFYFCFITLSTIGFGDLVPGNLGYETREAQIKLVALALYLLVGLAVLAMSFSLVQEEVVLKCKAFAQYIGLKDD